MAWYWIFCFIVFAVLLLTDIYEYGTIDFNDVLVDFAFAFIPLVNFYMALKMLYLAFEMLCCKAVDGVWSSKFWDKL